MADILVTGANGFIAQKILLSLSAREGLSFSATSRNPEPALPLACRYDSADLTEADAVNKLIKEHSPRAVIHCAALSKPDECEKNPEACRKTNVEAVSNLIESLKGSQTFLVFLSTDFVFDGESAPYSEEDALHPLSVYGQSKVEAEALLQKSCLPNAIVRTSLVYGIIPGVKRSNILIRVKEALEQGQTFRVVSDQVRKPTLVDDLAEACITLAENKLAGTYHISGKDRVSIYDFACRSAECFGLDTGLLLPTETADLNEPAKRPRDTSFSIEKAARAFGYSPHSLADGLEIVKGFLQGRNQ